MFYPRLLLSEYFVPVDASRREKHIFPVSGFRQPTEQSSHVYPLAAKQTVLAVSEVLKDKKEGSYLPVSTGAYEAFAYRVQSPLWNPDTDNFNPFQRINSKDATPVLLR